MTMKKAGLLIIFILHLFILSKLTFTAWPEMLSYPYLFSKGFLLYKDFIMPYPPALVLLLSGVFKTFGFTPEVLRSFTWVYIIFVDLILYLSLFKITKSNRISFAFLIVYIFLQSFLEGNMLWFDFATVLPLLLGFWFILKWFKDKELKYIFLSSFLLTLAILIKQTSVIYFLGVLGFLWIRGIRVIRVIGGGILVLMIPLIIYLVKTESLIFFWNWILVYPVTEWSNFPGYVDFMISKRETIITLLLLSPMVFVLAVWKKLFADKLFLLTLIFLTAALIAVYPRFSFFHMQPAIAFLVLAFAQIFLKLQKKWQQIYLSYVVIMVVLITSLSFKAAVGDSIRFYSMDDQKMAQKIAQVVKNSDKVFFLGINSSEYVFTNKLPPKYWSDNFGWYLEIPGVQEWVIEGLENEPPKKILWRIPSPGLWFNLGSYQPKKITEYIKTHYRKTDNIERGIEIWERNSK